MFALFAALRPYNLQRNSKDVRLRGPRRNTVCRVLQESIQANAIWHYLELHLYDNYMCLDFCAPKYATAEQVEGTMESIEVNVLDDRCTGVGASVGSQTMVCR